MKGGYRTGAGRKQGFAAKNAEEARRMLSEMVMRDITPIGEALVAKAKNGDVIAVRELFDRAFGKSPQTAKIELERKNPVAIYFDKAFEGVDVPPIYGGLSVKPKLVEDSQVTH